MWFWFNSTTSISWKPIIINARAILFTTMINYSVVLLKLLLNKICFVYIWSKGWSGSCANTCRANSTLGITKLQEMMLNSLLFFQVLQDKVKQLLWIYSVTKKKKKQQSNKQDNCEKAWNLRTRYRCRVDNFKIKMRRNVQ